MVGASRARREAKRWVLYVGDWIMADEPCRGPPLAVHPQPPDALYFEAGKQRRLLLLLAEGFGQLLTSTETCSGQIQRLVLAMALKTSALTQREVVQISRAIRSRW